MRVGARRGEPADPDYYALAMLADPEVFRGFLAAISNDLVAHLRALVEVAQPTSALLRKLQGSVGAQSLLGIKVDTTRK